MGPLLTAGRVVALGAVGFGALLAQVDFTSTITLGALLTSSLVILLGGVYSIRSSKDANAAKNWQTNYFAEKEHRERLEAENKEQRELKHNALNEVAALRMTRDLVPLMNFMKESRDVYDARFAALEANSALLGKVLTEQTAVLGKISRALESMGKAA